MLASRLQKLKTALLAATSLGLAAPALAAKPPVTFVAAIIQSGPFKVTDGQNLAGIQFAVNEINARGGINGAPIKLDVIDTELNAATTKRKATDAVLQDHAAAIIGASGSDVLRALIAVGQQYQVPVFAFAGETDELTGSQFQPALFRIASSTTMHANAVVYALMLVSRLIDRGHRYLQGIGHAVYPEGRIETCPMESSTKNDKLIVGPTCGEQRLVAVGRIAPLNLSLPWTPSEFGKGLADFISLRRRWRIRSRAGQVAGSLERQKRVP